MHEVSFDAAAMQSLFRQSVPPSLLPIRTIALCAGSGGSVLAGAADADLWVTGEIAHHEVLAAIERGTCVIALNHSNSERSYLGAVMKGLLEKELAREWTDGGVEVKVSEKDADPLAWVVRD